LKLPFSCLSPSHERASSSSSFFKRKESGIGAEGRRGHLPRKKRVKEGNALDHLCRISVIGITNYLPFFSRSRASLLGNLAKPPAEKGKKPREAIERKRSRGMMAKIESEDVLLFLPPLLVTPLDRLFARERTFLKAVALSSVFL